YLIGAIPCGYLIARACGINDIRNHGSGNTGATNVGRILGLKYFFLIFFLDCLKAYAVLAVLAHYGFEQSDLIIPALALLVGNAFPLFLRFRGGKGVATSVGILAAIN